VVTDAELSTFAIPGNVQVIQSTLEDIKKIFRKAIEIDIKLDEPYKLCDYKPLYWILADHFHIRYDYWGHCDIDLLFGDLQKFLAEAKFHTVNRCFGLGHLSIYKNSPLAKLAFTLPKTSLNWKHVYTSSTNLGFDEHYGVNQIWKRYKLGYLEDESVVADIDPGIRRLSLTSISENSRNQLFFWHGGKVFQGYYDAREKWRTKEYAYIHFQKRQLALQDLSAYLHLGVAIASKNLVPLKSWPPSVEFMTQHTAHVEKLTAAEMIYSVRALIRRKKRGLLEKIS
jgi:hypothetical protein